MAGRTPELFRNAISNPRLAARSDGPLIARTSVWHGESPAAVGARVRRLLTDRKVVHISGVHPEALALRRFYDTIVDAIGIAANLSEDSESGRSVQSRWVDVRFDTRLQQRTFRHSSTAQPLHTDSAYDSRDGAVTIMYCERQATAGGETIFLDGLVLTDLLAQKAPDLLGALRQTPLTFSKTGRSQSRHVIGDGPDPLLTWNYFRLDPETPRAASAIATRLHAFLNNEIAESKHIVGVRLNPGDSVIWHDERVLHGRSAFVASRDDERLLWKASIHVDWPVEYGGGHR